METDYNIKHHTGYNQGTVFLLIFKHMLFSTFGCSRLADKTSALYYVYHILIH